MHGCDDQIYNIYCIDCMDQIQYLLSPILRKQVVSVRFGPVEEFGSRLKWSELAAVWGGSLGQRSAAATRGRAAYALRETDIN